MNSNLSVRLLTPELRKTYLWPAIGVLVSEAMAYRERQGSIELQGGIRNIPELCDFENCFLRNLDGCLAIDAKGGAKWLHALDNERGRLPGHTVIRT